jgi:hypothetical protein
MHASASEQTVEASAPTTVLMSNDAFGLSFQDQINAKLSQIAPNQKAFQSESKIPEALACQKMSNRKAPPTRQNAINMNNNNANNNEQINENAPAQKTAKPGSKKAQAEAQKQKKTLQRQNDKIFQGVVREWSESIPSPKIAGVNDKNYADIVSVDDALLLQDFSPGKIAQRYEQHHGQDMSFKFRDNRHRARNSLHKKVQQEPTRGNRQAYRQFLRQERTNQLSLMRKQKKKFHDQGRKNARAGAERLRAGVDLMEDFDSSPMYHRLRKMSLICCRVIICYVLILV